jgi:P pilus assembly chaperone PapD
MFLRLRLGFCVLILATGAMGSSFTLNPWILIFEPQNKLSAQVVSFSYQADGPGGGGKIDRPLTNDRENAPVPVEVNISAREITIDGAVVYPTSEGADDFVVYPSQFILYPGDTKKVQVQWVGEKIPTREMTLGFIATQVPLKFKEKVEQPKTAIARVEVERRYEGIIVVRPPGIKPSVVVDTSYVRNDSSGLHMVFILNNKGTGMQSLKNMDFTVSPLDKNGKIRFNEKILVKGKPQDATSQSLIAGFRRKVDVPWPAGFPVGPFNAIVSFPDASK